MLKDLKDIKIGVIGLGYVGLPLARLFATRYPVVGLDLKAARISELTQGIDSTLEVDSDKLNNVLVSSAPQKAPQDSSAPPTPLIYLTVTFLS